MEVIENTEIPPRRKGQGIIWRTDEFGVIQWYSLEFTQLGSQVVGHVPWCKHLFRFNLNSPALAPHPLPVPAISLAADHPAETEDGEDDGERRKSPWVSISSCLLH